MNWRRALGHWTLNDKQPLTAWATASEPLRVPFACANCLAPSTHTARCKLPGKAASAALLIPYCSRCYKSLEAAKTRVVFGVCASLGCALVALLAVPLSAWDLSMGLYAALVLVASLAPLILAFVVRPAPLEGQTSSDIAVWAEARVIVGTNARWMTELASGPGGVPETRAGRTRMWKWPTWSSVVLSPIVALAVYPLFYPPVMVLNLSVGEFTLLVDGRRKVTVGVTSLESATAASRITLPVGHHRLEARLSADGELLQAAEVNVDALGLYLFAPGADGHCFWTETSRYGKQRTEPAKRRLGGKDGFFVLPSRIDTWFAPNPPTNDDSRSSGGEMVALRHGRCSD